MKKLMIFLICCSAFIAVQCKQQPAADTSASDVEAIRKADMAWAEQSGNIDAHLSYFMEDAMILAPNKPMMSGKADIRKMLEEMYQMPGFSINWKPTNVEVSSSGDMGSSVGTYELSMNDSTGMKMKDSGKYLTIWKKQADGKWMVSADMFNTNMPMH
ncbi:DUF4440 domain-containing protein [Flavobacteriaceae bacterium KMM 6897]|nr:DUF4440 domain-containing protein [Flavobacteriaceae bacterium KMM 6897]MEB8346246.1 DUF4440 domain-containing protein [Flavobacteriaceae bacterium KMM 6898]